MRRLIVLLWCALVACEAGDRNAVRKPVVAGAFYPADPKVLAGAVDGFIAKAKPPAIKDVVAVVVPHAGYVYSGGVAGNAYALVKGRQISRVVVISPSHVDAFPFASVYDGAAYETPLGMIPVDGAFAEQLTEKNSRVKLSNRGHVVEGNRGEHAIEVQLPFLQRALGRFSLVPIIMGDQDYETCRALGTSLAKLIRGPETLIVISSDLSHFHRYDEAVKLDHKTLRAIEEWDYLSMARNFEMRIWEACGGGPIIAGMIAAERLGATRATLLQYANSGDVTGDRDRVVGYGAVALSKPAPGSKSSGAAFSLSRPQKDELMRLARKSTETAVNERKLYEGPASSSEVLMQERGAFVTLKKHGALRGCIGYVAPMKPLFDTVREVAALAAMRDTRFPPVSAKELPELEYEISVLSPLRRVLDVKEIEVGRHGLVMKKGSTEGLLLPQVPVEQGWDRATFLQQTCVKAGLPPGAWKDGDTDIFSFTAVVFGEEKPGVKVTRK